MDLFLAVDPPIKIRAAWPEKHEIAVTHAVQLPSP